VSLKGECEKKILKKEEKMKGAKRTGIILGVLVIVAIGAFVFTRNKTNVSNNANISDNSTIGDILKVEKNVAADLKTAFDKLENDYQKGKASYSGYTRSAFYNEQRMEMAFEKGTVSYVKFDQIQNGDIYNTKGEKLKSYKDIDLAGEIVADDSLMETGKSYIIKVEHYFDSNGQNFYYLAKVSDSGISELRWICYTENEETAEEILRDSFDGDITDMESTDEYGGLEYE